ncbi:MAG: protein-L-isoaspartate(D-aspartate) O-methyltransferase, partial [Saprospiraceae bacterium]|nr:protein-L-isoaspartate(D-aspartate) O-methyltransferase [Saprospiraceae bacterium]
MIFILKDISIRPNHTFLHILKNIYIYSCDFYMVTDNYRQKGLRKKLVAELASKGIKDEQVLEAILKVPRHAFLDKAFEEWSYKDQAFPIDCEQTISQPYTVAFQTSLLKLIKGEKVLEIGLGSGYQACVLFEMGAKVYSIERHKYLHDKTAQRLKHLGYMGIRTFYGDGFLGLPRFAPFDKILITAACPEIPSKLLEQLKPGGLMVLP